MNKKRFMSFALALSMLFSCIPTNMLAKEQDDIVLYDVEAEDSGLMDGILFDEPGYEYDSETSSIDTSTEDLSFDYSSIFEDDQDEESDINEDEPIEMMSEEVSEEPVTEEEILTSAEAFDQGYVRVKSGTVVFSSEDGQEEMGTFTSDDVVYATVSTRAEDEAYSWLRIAFDTAVAKEADEPILIGYVQFKDVDVIADEVIEQLFDTLQYDNTLRRFEDNLLPVVEFIAIQDESAETVPTEIIEQESLDEEFQMETLLARGAEGTDATISVNPEIAYVNASEVAVFTATVEGATEDISYQWEWTPKGKENWKATTATGNKTATLKMPAIDSRLANEYRCVATIGTTVLRSEAVWFERPVATITVSPEIAYVNASEVAVFTATVEGATEDISYQWEWTPKGKENWKVTTATGNKTATLKLPAIDSRLANEYRCVATIGTTVLRSEAVWFERPAATITVSPEIAYVKASEVAVFTATVEGATEDISYQWEWTPKGKENWKVTTATGNKTATLKLPAIDSRLANEYRCVATIGTTVLRSEAVWFERPAATITVSPEIAYVKASEVAVFTATVEGATEDISYQWEWTPKGQENWKVTTATGNKTATLKLPAIDSRLANEYRCVATIGTTVLRSEAVWFERPAATITVSPEIAYVKASEVAVFTATVEGATEDISYQWEWTPKGQENWKVTTATGNKTATLKLPAIDSRLANEYRCVATIGTTVLRSEAVWFERPAATITVSPEIAYVKASEVAVFTATVEGATEDISYQWEWTPKGKENWKVTSATGNKTATLKLPAIDSRLANEYRCVVTIGTTVLRSEAVWFERPAATITVSPAIAEVEANEVAVFTATVEGATEDISYQWEWTPKGKENWKATSATGNKTATLKLPAIDSRLANEYRCVATIGTTVLKSEAVWFERPKEFTIDYTDYSITYFILENRTDVSVKSYVGIAQNVIVPEIPREGYTVTEIGVEAFMDNTHLVSIDLPDTITVIHARAFKGCTSLSNMF